MQCDDDWALVLRARQGDVRAFEALINRYERPVRHFIERMTGSAEDAEDLAQASFLRLYRSLGRLEARAKFSTALFGIARNLTLNHLRDEARRGRGKKSDIDEHPLMDKPSRRPDVAAGQSELATLIESALALLKPEHREILILRETEDMDYTAIAQVLGCRIGTVRSRLARAREQLRLHLETLGVECP